MRRNLNLRRRQAQAGDVAATEKIAGPAGTVDAWRIEAIGADGVKVTLWIDKQTYRHVKIARSPPNEAVVSHDGARGFGAMDSMQAAASASCPERR
jgi:hypothetical protein